MQSTTRKNLARLSLAPCLLFSVLSPAVAQDSSQFPLPPKVLVIMREYLKPGKTGSMHTKTESAYVNAMAAAKWPVHYFAMDSMSGAPRTLFFTGYDSFVAWEKDAAAAEKNATLSAAIERAYTADGDLLSAYDSGTFAFREDLSLNPRIDIVHMRFFEISQFIVKPGHAQEFEEIGKMYAGAYAKMTPENHWAVFESMYGANNGGIFLVISPYKSLSEVDRSLASSKQFADALGESGMKKLAELTSSAIVSFQTNVFHFNPRISYPEDTWVQADPTFWKPKPAAAAKPAAKPAP